jgi:DNA-binding transcriptional MerR regulator
MKSKLCRTKEKIIEKKYFSIGEVADMLGVATSLIRFWETEFDNIKPKKNRKGNRQFTKEDIENVKLIFHLVKEKGYTLQGAKDLLKNDSETLNDKMDMISNLKDIRSFLVNIRDQL